MFSFLSKTTSPSNQASGSALIRRRPWIFVARNTTTTVPRVLVPLYSNFSNKFGARKYNLIITAEPRSFLDQDSMMHKPQFSLVSSRLFTGYGKSVFPISFFIDGRQKDGQLNLTIACGFF
jgi:hypothetical protein